MNEKEIQKAATDAAAQEGVNAEVKITLEKKAGEDRFKRSIEASSASAALNGLAILLTEYAALIGVNVLEVLSLLAVVLAGRPSRQTEEQYAGTTRGGCGPRKDEGHEQGKEPGPSGGNGRAGKVDGARG